MEFFIICVIVIFAIYFGIMLHNVEETKKNTDIIKEDVKNILSEIYFLRHEVDKILDKLKKGK